MRTLPGRVARLIRCFLQPMVGPPGMPPTRSARHAAHVWVVGPPGDVSPLAGSTPAGGSPSSPPAIGYSAISVVRATTAAGAPVAVWLTGDSGAIVTSADAGNSWQTVASNVIAGSTAGNDFFSFTPRIFANDDD